MNASSTRDRLIRAMCSGLSRRGLHGVGLTELLAEAGAPKGVLYHHFPGGKDELAVQAIEATVHGICGGMDRALASGLSPWEALQAWMLRAEEGLAGSGFERGCPLGTVALESSPHDQ
ncbi:MAG TPA: TetR/AcrR family transcriptional regulator [Pseudoxanthomonas sp.]|nr:TetR/AcrR family transcriptional regulator [Pseudoxanthomonas sp.]